MGFAFAFLALLPGGASAYQHTFPPYQDPSYEQAFTDLLDGAPSPDGLVFPNEWTYPGGAKGPPPNWWQNKWWPLEEDAGRIPKFTGTILLSAAAFDFGWKIGRVIDTKFLHLQDPDCIIFGCPATPSGTPQAPYAYAVYKAGGYPSTANLVLLTAPTVNGWVGEGSSSNTAQAISTTGATTTQPDRAVNAPGAGGLAACSGANYDGAYFYGSNSGNVYTGSDGACAQLFNVDMAEGGTKYNAFISAGYTPYSTAYGSCGNGCPSGTGVNTSHMRGTILFKPDTAVQGPLLSSGGGVQSFTAQKVDGTTTMPTTSCGTGGTAAPCAPATNATSTQLATARAEIASGDPGLGGGASCMLAPADYICPTAPTDPGTTNPGFTLPRPLPNETYDLYVARLRALGFLGAIVFLDDIGYDGLPTDAYPLGSPALDLKPGTVTGVGLSIPVIIPLYWPNGSPNAGQEKQWQSSAAPTINPNTVTTLTIQRVPLAYVPPGGTGTGGSGNPPGAPTPPPGSGGCNLPNIPSVDLSPLTGMTFGSKFPFGVFGWASTVIGYFNVSAVTPEMNFDMSGLSSFVPGFSAHYDVKLDQFDGYMTTIRALISFALWVGAIWYIGVTLLGFRGGGDMSDAADDGFPL